MLSVAETGREGGLACRYNPTREHRGYPGASLLIDWRIPRGASGSFDGLYHVALWPSAVLWQPPSRRRLGHNWLSQLIKTSLTEH